MLTFFTTSASPTTCKTSPGQEDWIGDRICDDDYNNQQCNWDGGDCCLDENPGSDCLDPNSPNYSGSTTPSQQTTTTKQETTMTTTKATFACDISPGEEDWIGDDVCDDKYNNQECNWDGGDCCQDEIAFEIFCLDPNSPNYIGNNHFPNP